MNKLIAMFRILSLINLTVFLTVVSSLYFADVILFKLFAMSLFLGYINLFFLIVLLLKNFKLILYILLNLAIVLFYWCDLFGFTTLISE